MAKVKKPVKHMTQDDIKDHYCHCGKFGRFGRKDNGWKARTIWFCWQHWDGNTGDSSATQDLFGER